MPDRIERLAVAVLLGARWLMAPLYVGLIAALLIDIVEFFREIVHVVVGFPTMTTSAVILAALKLVDLVLIGNLVLILTAAGTEIFSSRPIALANGERPSWLGETDFGALKLKILASLVAIAAVDLLESYFDIEAIDKTAVMWQIAIMLSFGVAGVLLALIDRLGERH